MLADRRNKCNRRTIHVNASPSLEKLPSIEDRGQTDRPRYHAHARWTHAAAAAGLGRAARLAALADHVTMTAYY